MWRNMIISLSPSLRCCLHLAYLSYFNALQCPFDATANLEQGQREFVWSEQHGYKGVRKIWFMVGWVHHERRPLTYSLRAIGPEPRPCSDRASMAWAVTDGGGLFESPWAGVWVTHICRQTQWTETKWQTHRAHRVPVHWDTLMIIDAGLLTVTSVRENNNQRTGNDSAVFLPLWNTDMLVSVLG